MFRRVLLTSALGLGLASPALAQDAQSWNWTGAYAGLNLGYGGGETRAPFSGTTDAAGTNPVGGQLKQSTSGVLGGAQIGYNYVLPNGLLVGLETDIDASDIGGKTSYFSQDSLGNAYSGAVQSRIDYLGTVRGRVGEAMFGGRFLPYVTGGFAYGGVRTSAAYGSTGFTSPVQGVTGWTAGAGAEYALTRHLSFKAEYLYADFGQRSVDLGSGQFTGPGVSLYNASVDQKTDANIVRVGLNYRF